MFFCHKWRGSAYVTVKGRSSGIGGARFNPKSQTQHTSILMTPTSMTLLGANILRFTMPLAQDTSEMTEQFSGIINILNLVGLVLAFGGLLFAAVMFMMGQTERVLYGLVGAGIGGLSFIIIKVMFQTSSGSSLVNDIEMGN